MVDLTRRKKIKPEPKTLTPAQVEERRLAAAERKVVEDPNFLRDREKRTKGLIDQGLSEKVARTQAGQGLREGRSAEIAATTKREAEESQAVAKLEESGVLTEQQPERVSLAPEEITGLEAASANVPIIGPGIAALRDLVKGVVGIKEDSDPLLQDPESIKEIALQEIQKEVISQGLSSGEKFGSLIESIPIVGSLVGQYASGLVEDPKGNIETILTQIDSERERASVLAEQMRSSKINPFVGLDQLDTMEENIIRLEQRIKILANTSAQLKASADEVNRIEEKILRAKERIFIARQAAAAGVITEPTPASTFFALRDLKGGT